MHKLFPLLKPAPKPIRLPSENRNASAIKSADAKHSAAQLAKHKDNLEKTHGKKDFDFSDLIKRTKQQPDAQQPETKKLQEMIATTAINLAEVKPQANDVKNNPTEKVLLESIPHLNFIFPNENEEVALEEPVPVELKLEEPIPTTEPKEIVAAPASVEQIDKLIDLIGHVKTTDTDVEHVVNIAENLVAAIEIPETSQKDETSIVHPDNQEVADTLLEKGINASDLAVETKDATAQTEPVKDIVQALLAKIVDKLQSLSPDDIAKSNLVPEQVKALIDKVETALVKLEENGLTDNLKSIVAKIQEHIGKSEAPQTANVKEIATDAFKGLNDEALKLPEDTLKQIAKLLYSDT
ncbi:MAG: hypothetical protein HRU28_10290, partial [Rhizobiales bacterium]|nr:hypothetical protein [Hyphomicrobiales bacterium]